MPAFANQGMPAAGLVMADEDSALAETDFEQPLDNRSYLCYNISCGDISRHDILNEEVYELANQHANKFATH